VFFTDEVRSPPPSLPKASASSFFLLFSDSTLMNPIPPMPILDESPNSPPIRLGRLTLLFLAITLLFCLGNGTLPLIDRDEPRFAEASREMAKSQNWIVPAFNSKPRYDKPPLIYWMQVASYRAIGDNEIAARLPAALCTAATAILLILWGNHLGDQITGSRAALIFVLSIQVFVHGRAAVADPPMILCLIAATWLGWEWIRSPNNLSLAAAFWIVLALGFLAKGPIAWVPIAMAGRLAFRRNREGHQTPSAILWVLGPLIMLALVGLWGIPALHQTKGAFAAKGLGEHVVGRSLIAMEGHGAKGMLGYIVSLPFYFLTLFPSFAPWSLWIPAAIRFHRKNSTELSSYLLSGVVTIFAVFTLSRTKLPHYTLPALPLLALLLAIWWRQERKPASLFRKVAAITAAIFILVPLFVFPRIAALSASESIASLLAPVLPKDTAVALVDYEEPSLIWALRRELSGFPLKISAAKVPAWLEEPGPRCCILSAALAQNVEGPWGRRESAGWNFAKGKRIKLVALTSHLNPNTVPASPASPHQKEHPSATLQTSSEPDATSTPGTSPTAP
jgi:4-amino-4-deoxy-L-arabinose transferase-like glycosyltransferase